MTTIQTRWDGASVHFRVDGEPATTIEIGPDDSVQYAYGDGLDGPPTAVYTMTKTRDSISVGITDDPPVGRMLTMPNRKARRSMKCSDIPDLPILRLLATYVGEWFTHGAQHAGGMATVQDAMPAGTPEKLQRAKMAMLIRRGVVSGCACGCRGDYKITNSGLAEVEARRAK